MNHVPDEACVTSFLKHNSLFQRYNLPDTVHLSQPHGRWTAPVHGVFTPEEIRSLKKEYAGFEPLGRGPCQLPLNEAKKMSFHS